MYPRITVKASRDKSIRAFHPWVFTGAIDHIDKKISNGDIVDVVSHRKEFLGRGMYSESSSIAVRILTFDDVPVDRQFFMRRLTDARELRDSLKLTTNALRLCNGSGDFLPGLYLDAYGDYIVLQCTSAGIAVRKDMIIGCINHLYSPKGIFDRTDTTVKAEEMVQITQGTVSGAAPPRRLVIEEDGVEYPVFISEGQKTGFYLDLRTSRSIVRRYAANASVLNLFSYTGSFSLCSLKAGARNVVSVESSKQFVQMLDDEISLAMSDAAARHTNVCANAFEYLRTVADNEYDMVIVDPPPLCQRKHDVTKSSRAYKDCNMHAIRVAKKGGFVLTLCCSHHISIDLFRKIVFAAAKDTGRMVQILAVVGQEPDHPVNVYHPETEYFKGFLLAVR